MSSLSLKSLFSGVASRYISMFITVFSLMILGKVFGQEELGKYSSFFGISSSFCYWIGLGMSEAILKVAHNNNSLNKKWLYSNSFYSHLFTLLFAIVTTSVIFLFTITLSLDFIWAYIALWTASWGVTISISHILILNDRNQVGNLIFYGFPASVPFASIVIGWLLDFDVYGVICFLAITYALISLFFSLLLLKKLFNFGVCYTDFNITNLLTDGVLYSSSRVVQTLILWCPVWLASAYFGHEEAGLVAIVFRLGLSVNAFMSVVRLMLRKVNLMSFSSGEKNHEYTFRYMSFIGTYSSLICLLSLPVVFFFGDSVLQLFFSIYDQNAKYLLMIILFALSIECMFSLQEDLLKNVISLLSILRFQLFSLCFLVVFTFLAKEKLDLYVFAMAFFFQVFLYHGWISFKSLKEFDRCIKPVLKI